MINIIPAIDISGGKCVRLTKGDYSRSKTYFDDPLQAAALFKDCGAARLHLVDLDGAKSSSPVNLSVLERIVRGTGMEVEFGGGIKTTESIHSVFSAGASHAICGSVAVSSPDLFDSWLREFAGKIILGADHRKGFIAVKGWLEDTGTTVEDLLLRYPTLESVICTDISRDGTLSGVDAAFYSALQGKFPGIDVIASGGISSMEDIALLDSAGIKGVIVGKAIYEGRITPEDIRKFMENAV